MRAPIAVASGTRIATLAGDDELLRSSTKVNSPTCDAVAMNVTQPEVESKTARAKSP
jgi:hypothetical protein